MDRFQKSTNNYDLSHQLNIKDWHFGASKTFPQNVEVIHI